MENLTAARLIFNLNAALQHFSQFHTGDQIRTTVEVRPDDCIDSNAGLEISISN